MKTKRKKKKKNDYWGERASEIREEALKIADGASQRIYKIYLDAANNTLKEYAKLVKPYKLKNGEYDIQAIKRAYRQDQGFRFKYRRLLSNFNVYLNKIGKNEQIIINDCLIRTYRITDKLLLNTSWNLLHEKAVEMVVKTPWTSDGVHYSSRVWKNVNALKVEMESIMLDSVMRGQNPRKIARKVSERFGVGARASERLVRTETMAIYNRAAFDSYQELGIDEYEILGSPDDTMCEPSGTRHFMYEFNEGHTAPPFHPNCKCCIIPVVKKFGQE